MPNPYYPMFLDLRGRRAVVIGGGDVAERKIEGLVKAHALVTVISPAATAGVAACAADGIIRWLQREYRAGDLEEAWIAIAATDCRQVNAAVAAEADARRIPLNVVDDRTLCTFIAPAVIDRGELVIAISTGGKSPAAARRIREELERLLPPEYTTLVDVLSDVREQLRREGLQAPSELWNRALTDHVLELVRERKDQEARDALLQLLRSGVPGR